MVSFDASVRKVDRAPLFIGLALLGLLSFCGASTGWAADEESGASYRWFNDGTSCRIPVSLIEPGKGFLQELERGSREALAISASEEMALGRGLAEMVSQHAGAALSRRSDLAAYVRSVGESLVSHVKRDGIEYSFAVLESDQPNAFAMPGGFVYVTTSFLRHSIENEAQLAGVLAHEIAHVDRRHTVAVYQAMKKLPGGQSQDIGKLMGTFMRMPVSQAHEKEADLGGIEIMIRAGYSPFQTVRFLESLPSKESVRTQPPPVGDPGAMLDYMVRGGLEELEESQSSHPQPAHRACRLKRALYRARDELSGKSFVVGRSRYLQKTR